MKHVIKISFGSQGETIEKSEVVIRLKTTSSLLRSRQLERKETITNAIYDALRGIGFDASNIKVK